MSTVWITRLGALAVIGSLLFWVFSPNQPQPDEGQVRIRFSDFGNLEQRRIYEHLIEFFEEEHPEIDVVLEWVSSGGFLDKIKIRMAGHVAPDVFWLDVMSFYSFADKQVLHPLDEFIERDPDFDIDDYFPSIIDAFTFEGQFYALPKSCGSNVLYYNRGHLEEAGVPIPDASLTWQDIREFGPRLNADTDGDGRVDRFAIIGVDPMLLVLQNGGRFFDDSGRRCLLDSDEVEEACQFFVDLMYEDHLLPTISQQSALGFHAAGGGSGAWRGSVFDMFPGGVVSLFPTDLVLSVTYVNAEDIEWDIAPLPQLEGRPPYCTLNGAGYAMSAHTQHPEEAWLLIQHLGGPVAQNLRAVTGDSTPSMRSIAQSPVFMENERVPINREVLVEQIDWAEALPYHPRWMEIFREFSYAADLMTAETNRPPVRQALRDATERINELLAVD